MCHTTFPTCLASVPPPLWGGDTLVCGPCIACAYCRGHAGIDFPAAARDPAARPRGSSPSSLLWALLVPGAILTSKSKRDKTGPFTQPQPEGMQTSMNLSAFSRPRDAEFIFEFGFGKFVFADWRLSQPPFCISNCPALEPPLPIPHAQIDFSSPSDSRRFLAFGFQFTDFAIHELGRFQMHKNRWWPFETSSDGDRLHKAEPRGPDT